MDKGESVQSFGPWATSVRDGPHPFYKGLLLIDGGKITVGGTALFSGQGYSGTKDHPTGGEVVMGLADKVVRQL